MRRDAQGKETGRQKGQETVRRSIAKDKRWRRNRSRKSDGRQALEYNLVIGNKLKICS
jgi:hypothetical protein